jgi:protein-disulfide isomerase
VEAGIRVGPPTAAVTIIEFMDMECPFCQRLAFAMDSLRSEFPDDIAVVVHHFPLTNHRFARIAAVAVECADDQGAFEQFFALLFQKQDSIGLKDWDAFAAEAGVADIDEFANCRQTNSTFPRIDYGRAFGESIGVRGTPTVVINGWKMPRVPQLNDLRASVRAVLAGGLPLSDVTDAR